MEETNLGNIDDFIRQEKARGEKEIIWTEDKYEVFKVFAFLRDKNSGMYMGIRHLKK